MRSTVLIIIVGMVLLPIALQAQNIDSVGAIRLSGPAAGLAVAGNYAYVSELAHLDVVDVSDPENPQIIGGCDVSAGPGLAIGGEYLFVIGGNRAVSIIDISNPSTPTVVGHFEVSGFYGRGLQVEDISVVWPYAYVVLNVVYPLSDFGLLSIWSISDIANPESLGTDWGFAPPAAIYVSDNYAFIVNWDGFWHRGGLDIINITEPSDPTRVGICRLEGYSGDVYVRGDYAYIASDSVYMVDVTNRGSPIIVAGFSLWGPGSAIIVYGDYVYTGSFYYSQGDTTGIQIIDISNPTAPILVSEFRTASDVKGIHVGGDYIYVVEDSALVVLCTSSKEFGQFVS